MSSERETLIAAAKAGKLSSLDSANLCNAGMTIEDVLIAGIEANNLDIIDFCLSHDAKPTYAVELALYDTHPTKETFQRLIAAGLDLNSLVREPGGYIVRFMYIDLPLVEFLLQNGADADRGARFSDLPALALTMMEEEFTVETSKLLVKYGADHHRPGLLALAAGNGRLDMVDYLLSLGVDINAEIYGQLTNGPTGTVLHYLAEDGPSSMIRSMVERGADVTAKDKQGRTALNVAKERGQTGCVEVLMNIGTVAQSKNHS